MFEITFKFIYATTLSKLRTIFVMFDKINRNILKLVAYLSNKIKKDFS